MSPCQSCHAGCCRSFAVPVTGADILSIQRRLGLSFWDFACRWADPSGRIARNYAPHFHFSDEPKTPFVICLLHSESKFFPGTAKCRFLTECPPDAEHPLGQARCGIYGCRPAACRVFPTKFDATGDLAVVHDVPARGRAGTNPLYDLCPRQWEPSDLDPIGSVQDLALAKFEMTFFTKIAQVWNRSPRSWTMFPEFLEVVYTNRLQREVSEEVEAVTLPFPGSRQSGAKRAAA